MRSSYCTHIASIVLLSATASAQAVGGGSGEVYQWDGITPGDAFGTSVADAGDVNGDGVADIIVGAPFADPSGLADAGSATVYSGIDGAIILPLQGIAAEDQFGTSVSSVGDLNGDGYADVMVGAPKHDPGGILNAGSAFVYSGYDGALLIQLDGEANGDNFGHSLADAGDVNADGTTDFIIGAWGTDFGNQEDVGSAYVYSGADSSLLHQWNNFKAEDHFGWSVANAGDINADGFADLLIGAPRVMVGSRYRAGSAFVYSGQDGSLLHEWYGEKKGDHFGNSVAAAGDIDEDGNPDFIIGAYKSDLGAISNVGSAYVYSGIDGSLIHQWRGEATDDQFGFSVAGIGDVDRDGQSDLLVGAPYANPEFTGDAGSAYVYSGAGGTLIRQWNGAEIDSHFGGAVSGVGDVNGNGFANFLVGGPGANPSGLDQAGSAFVYSFDPFLFANTSEISSILGGVLHLNLDFPLSAAFDRYKVLISESGVGPINFGVPIPLTLDALLQRTYIGNYPTPTANGLQGVLNANGDASGSMTIPAGGSWSYVGRTFYLAAIVSKVGELPEFSSIAVSLTILP